MPLEYCAAGWLRLNKGGVITWIRGAAIGKLEFTVATSKLVVHTFPMDANPNFTDSEENIEKLLHMREYVEPHKRVG